MPAADSLQELLALAQGPPDEPLDEDRGSAFVLVKVGCKPKAKYLDYIRGCVDTGLTVLHLVARGNAWIAKTHEITYDLLDDGRLRVYRHGLGSEQDGTPVVVTTLLPTGALPNVSDSNWDPSLVEEWRDRAACFREGRTESDKAPAISR